MQNDPRDRIAHDANVQLRRELQAQQQLNAATKAVMTNRAMVLIGEVIDAFNLISERAQLGDLNAKQQANGFLDALKNLQAASGKIIVLRGN